MAVSDGRRDFLKTMALGSALAMCPKPLGSTVRIAGGGDAPATNIADALAVPRTATSMPGAYPGAVVEVRDAGCVVGGTPDAVRAARMLERGMLELTGEADIASAWRQFVGPDDVVGLKVNPVAGKLLSTSLELTDAVIAQLAASGIPKKNIVIWDRREFELHEVGFTEERFPGVRIAGTEYKDEHGSFRDGDGRLYGERRIDRDVFYWADCEESYDEETMPYMVNEGKYSYFSTIVTRDVTKIINMPILKNAGSTVTLCLKNLAYGAVSNTARLHKPLWSETCAQVPCFAPLRDKTVLNIVDGMIGCYNGGPGANPQFITEFQTLLLGTDPVAVDRVGYEIVLAKRIAEQVQTTESPRATAFMAMAEEYGLGIARNESITRSTITLS